QTSSPHRLHLTFLFLLAAAVVAAAQDEKRSLTLEWTFGSEGRAIAGVPPTAWLDDGSLVILDNRRAIHERTFEKLNPASGRREPIVDASRALSELKTVAAVDLQVMPWPISFDGVGRRALYLFKGDVFVLELAGSHFRRLTSTPAEETSASFSPNGQRVAYVRDHDLHSFDLDTNRETRITRDGSETLLNGTLSWVYWEEVFGRRDIGYWWAPDSQAIAYLQSDDSQVDLSYFTDISPFSPRVIRQRYARAGRPNPRVRLGITELERPITTWIQIKEPFEYIVRAKWLPDSRRLSFETMPRLQTELSLYFADRKSGVSKRVLTETDPGWVNMTDDLYFFNDGQHFLWPSERDGYMHLYRYRIDGTPANQVTKGQWALASAGGIAFWVRQALVGVDEKNDWVYFTALERSSIERHLYRVHADGSGFMRVSKEAGTHRISMSPDARNFLDRYSDIRTLPALRLHASDGAMLQMVSAPRPELIAQYDVQFPELTSIPADDGFSMPTAILKPRGFRSDRRYPVIMFVYGGASAPQVSNAWQGDLLWNQMLLEAGYVVVKVDNRTATGISKTLENLTVKRVGEAETPDLVAAARWLKKQSWVDPERVGVWGWSNGGWMTLNLMTRSSEFKAGIAVAPVVDWRYYDSKWTEAGMRTPQENPEGYERSSLIPRAKDLHGHLLIVYGSYDDNVHPYNEMAFIDALVAAGKRFEMMSYPMRKHGIDDLPATLHLYRLMLDFWKANL
ncbi:MAG TPA: S9 family peptidase, partial [Pyrinomonadaceae bacterium]|nr:S9 family peptidase [Pyrinomonadaceae bacterium]